MAKQKDIPDSNPKGRGAYAKEIEKDQQPIPPKEKFNYYEQHDENPGASLGNNDDELTLKKHEFEQDD